MPQFDLNQPASRKHPFYALDTFARGYVEAMFFTNCDTGDERENLANELGVERLTKASIAAIKRDCDAFLGHIMPDGCFVRQWLNRADNYGDEQAGHDFWLTRQGHGAGFWDRDAIDIDLYPATAMEAANGCGGWYAADNSASRWEGAQPCGNIRDGLTKAAHAMGEVYPSIYRGWIHYN